MKSEVQVRIINILGAIAIFTLVEVLILQIVTTEQDLTLLNMLVMIPTSVVSLLGGFLTGRAIAKLEQKEDDIDITCEVNDETKLHSGRGTDSDLAE